MKQSTPLNAVYYKNRTLTLMGRKLDSYIRGDGHPVYVYSRKRILDNLSLLKKAFRSPLRIHYSVKANSNPEVLKLLQRQGVGVDVVSAGEVRRALECGFTPVQVIFSGVGKSKEEISYSLNKNIFLFNVESPQELERIGQLAKRLKKTARVSFRLNPDVNPKTHPYITTGFRENKFGMDASFLPDLLKILSHFKGVLELVGVDFHIGSQLMELGPFEAAVKKTVPIYLDLKSRGYPLRYFDIGGGVGISYDGKKPISIAEYGSTLERLLAPLKCETVCEPGRFIVGDAGVLLAQVEYIKRTPHKTFVILNTGMHHLLRPALYQAYHRILPLTKSARRVEKVDVVGPICESSDWIARDRKIPRLDTEDFVAICDAGAYGYVMASDYNLHQKPREILI